MSDLDRLEHRIRDAVDGALQACEQTEIRERPAAAEKLPSIVELAERLERELAELCGLARTEGVA